MGILRFKGLIWPLWNFYLRFEGLLEGEISTIRRILVTLFCRF